MLSAERFILPKVQSKISRKNRMSQLGYDDTPLIPGSKFKVHDSSRPQPRVVTVGDDNAMPPSDAVVLFDGKDISGWLNKENAPAQWKVENGYMEVVPGTGYIHTKEEFGDCQLHLELASPTEVKGDGQGRGNSGVFMMRKYEIQVLDCYQNPTYADGTSAAIYGEFPPLVNPNRAPGKWQTYDIIWIAPRFDGEKLITPARATVLFNGVVVHHDVALTGPTTHRAVLEYEAHPAKGALELQDHGDLVRFRNIWYRPLKGYDVA
jgi:hypothetical protein